LGGKHLGVSLKDRVFHPLAGCRRKKEGGGYGKKTKRPLRGKGPRSERPKKRRGEVRRLGKLCSEGKKNAPRRQTISLKTR